MTPEMTQNLSLMKSQMGSTTLNALQKTMSDFKKDNSKNTLKSDEANKTTGVNNANESLAANQLTDVQRKRWKASLDFESMFLSQMYKGMRATVNPEGNELTEASPGREIFSEMLDNQYASIHSKSPTESGDIGLENAINGVSNNMAAQIYRSLSRKEGDVLPLPNSRNISHGLRPLISSVQPVQRAKTNANQGALPDEKLNPLIDLASKTYGIAASLIKSVIKTESANHPKAISSAGAKGLMQLMDSTAQDMGVKDIFNPKENILAGTKYLKKLLDRFSGNEEHALAAYNAGPATVERFKGIPPYPETRNYVKQVLGHKNDIEKEAAFDLKNQMDVNSALLNKDLR